MFNLLTFRHRQIRCTDLLNRFLILQTSVKTTKQYGAIAAVTTQTLAVGSMFCAGIDLIDLSGRILRQLSMALYFHNLLVISYYLSLSYFQSFIIPIVLHHIFNIKFVALFSYKRIQPFSFLAFLTFLLNTCNSTLMNQKSCFYSFHMLKTFF